MRVLYTDIDGTLVGPLGNLLWDGDRKPTVAAAEALVRAASEGLEIVPLTGRTRVAMTEVARLVGAETWICELGGVRVYQRGAEVIHDRGACPEEGLPAAGLRTAADALVARFPGRIEEHTPWNDPRECSFVLRGDVDGTGALDALATAGYGWVDMIDNGVIPRRFPGLAAVERVHAYHLVPRGVSKAAAVAADRASRNIGRDECAVVGDAGADLDCRAHVGRCFLVANGLAKDPDLAWVHQPGSGVEITDGTFGAGFAEVVHRLLEGR